MIQGARYQRQAGEHFNPYTYDDIKTIADHLHYVGNTPHSGNDRSDSAGGGHAHAGAMIYLGGTWPDEYRNQIFMNNIHGQRVNMDILKPHGSGFVGSHGPDFLLTQDRASQMLNFRYGPDGQVYIIDWYDMKACHDPNPAVHDRTNGRIYKISYGENKPVSVDLQKKSDAELAELTLEKNDWYVRHSRRILQERAAAGKFDDAARTRLIEIASTNPDETRRLRAMWALHVTGGLPADLVTKLLADTNEYVRAWTIQLALDRDKPPIAGLVTAIRNHGDERSVASRAVVPGLRCRPSSESRSLGHAQRFDEPRRRCRRSQSAAYELVRRRAACGSRPRASIGFRVVLRQNDAHGPRFHAAARSERRHSRPHSPRSSRRSPIRTTRTSKSQS